MAGEIQIGGTTFATESGGTVTVANVNSVTNRTNLGLGSMATQNANAVAITGGTINTIQPATGQSLTIKDEDGNTAITVGTDNTATDYLSLNFGSYNGGSGSLTGNTLSDFEQGTWTPTISSGAGSITAYTAAGSYRKIGDVVYLEFSYNITNNGTGGGSIVITGLPYNCFGANRCSGIIREISVTGQTGGIYFSSTSGLLAVNYANGYPGGTNHYWVCTITYRAS